MECKELTACAIIKNLTQEAEMEYFAEHLHEMFLSFVKDYEGFDKDYKFNIVHTYESMRRLIQQVEVLQKQKGLV